MSQEHFGVVRVRKADKAILEALAKSQGRSVVNMLSVLIASYQSSAKAPQPDQSSKQSKSSLEE